jgi:hypothetical protein
MDVGFKYFTTISVTTGFNQNYMVLHIQRA